MNRPEPVLIGTKLTRSAARPIFVERKRLLDRLDEALEHRVTLVSAAPGFGKTTLIAQWLDRQPLPCAWLALDPFDSDPERFVRYLVAAVERASSHRLPETNALLSAQAAPPFEYLSEVLVSELAAVEEPLLLVLEDYHEVASDDVHQFVERLVQTMPASLHLIVLTRRDPPWPLGNWRAQEWFVELRGRDLRFSLEETRRLFATGESVSLSDATVGKLHEKTEGWIAALRLVKVSLRDTKDPEARVLAFSGRHRLVVDYLMGEILAAQPPEIRSFLAATAPMSRFCASLCEHLLGDEAPRPTARETLDSLEQANLLLVALDNDGQWYRYHHLFRDLLLQYLPELAPRDRRAEISRRAGEWFAREGLAEEALRHWIDAGELDAAADLVGEHILQTIAGDPSRRLLSRWMALFPPGAEHGRLPLLVGRGHVKTVTWDMSGLAEVLDEAEQLLRGASASPQKRERDKLSKNVDAMKAWLCYWSGDGEGALRHATRALEALPEHGGGIVRSLGLFYKAGGLALMGRKLEALSLLDDAIVTEGAVNPQIVAELLVIQACIHLYAADMASVNAVVRKALSGDENVKFSEFWMAMILHLRAMVAYERNELDEASADFRRVAASRYRTMARWVQDGMVGLSLVAHARGERTESVHYAAEVRALALEIGNPTALRTADSLDIRLALDDAERVPLSSALPSDADFLWFWLEVPTLTYAERLIHDTSEEVRESALPFIERALEQAEARYNVRLAIPLSLLKAEALADRGEQEAALSLIADVVSRAEPLGLVRTFVDRGPRLLALLEALAKREGQEGYLSSLLSAFHPSASPALSAGSDGTSLSNRELDVLELLAARLSNKEIADRLNVSPETVKMHASNLYRKLEVSGRRVAVAKAVREGLIPPPSSIL